MTATAATARPPVPTLAEIPELLARANEEFRTVLASFRASREALESATVGQIQHTSLKLQEVSSATELAATDIMDALDRAQGLVDDLDDAECADDRDRARTTRDLLREEIYGVMCSLQFHDIVTQQLAHATAMLAKLETRLIEIRESLAPSEGPGAAAVVAPDPRTFDPGATTCEADRRQSLADEIFTRPVA